MIMRKLRHKRDGMRKSMSGKNENITKLEFVNNKIEILEMKSVK